MSHFTTLHSRLTDIEILKVSLCQLGITVQTNAEVRGAGGQRVQADIVAVLEGDYDLGWSRSTQGSLDLIADLWGIARKHNLTKLMTLVNQKYAVNKTLVEVKQPRLHNVNVKLVIQ